MAEGKDPWVDVKTRHGFPADEVISALQKEIRRSETENAVLLAYEMVTTSPELEAFLWRRLLVISVEDIAFGNVLAPLMMYNLHQICQVLGRGAGERLIMAVHAVRYLCAQKKDRSSDEMLMWLKRVVEGGEVFPAIPDYAIDMHTRRGQDMGRDVRHFIQEAAKIDPELPDRDMTYRDRMLILLGLQEE
jgi:replication-associated recombination protein RarA